MSERYRARYAWLPTGLAADVHITVDAGRFATVTPNAPSEADEQYLDGVVVPGFANTHSHAFHRALRGRTQGDGGTFWTWREQMYAVAHRLDPDSYLALARAAFAEMALAGVAVVGEFHYLHHRPDGTPYADRNAMGDALMQAASDAGIRITLLDACYLTGGLDASGPRPISDAQRAFCDPSADAWASRVEARRAGAHARLGVAVHSVRAVPREHLGTVVAAAAGSTLHAHLSEQRAENEQCRAAYGHTPTEVLAAAGALTTATTAVHATHLTPSDIETLGASGASISICPTTERDLADGIGPARALREAGCRLVLGSDQHAITDLIEEMRGLEMHERLAAEQRGRFTMSDLVSALSSDGHPSLGWDDAGRIEPGCRADLTVVGLDSVRTAGSLPEQALLAASAADVTTVIVDGRLIVSDGRHVLGDVGRMLGDAVRPLAE